MAQTIGGILYGFEQQVLRTVPPGQELAHHARPDDPVPAGAGGFVTIRLPDDMLSVVRSDPAPDPAPGSAPGTDPALATDPSPGGDERR